ncbi:MAG TPA: hypothetical protein VFC46_13285 [Humisphaera sp.]|nr:hypothetical protein [Humisphaera sp.]
MKSVMVKNIETSSNEPAVVEVIAIRTPQKPAPESPELAALNSRINTDAERIMRAAEANTLRLTGKPSF